MPPEFVIAIDGPAGAGKSTVARAAARKLQGFRYVDTGAMYRAVTAFLLRKRGEAAAAARGLAFSGDRYLVHGEDMTAEIRTPTVTADVSRVSAIPEVRRVIQQKQREMSGRLVAEGRDIGSVVFPHAQLKIYLDASLEQRAQRRHREYPDTAPTEFEQTIEQRDHADSSRADSPLVCTDDAVRIDTSKLTIEEVVEQVVALVGERLPELRAGGEPGAEEPIAGEHS